MKNDFTAIDINSEMANDMLRDYAYYCDDKIMMNEMPYPFEQWQIANNDMKES